MVFYEKKIVFMLKSKIKAPGTTGLWQSTALTLTFVENSNSP